MATSLNVRRIGSFKNETNKHVMLPLYLLRRTPNGELANTFIRRELHSVDNLAADMLFGTDIFGLEGIIINLREKIAYVSSCAIILEIDAK